MKYFVGVAIPPSLAVRIDAIRSRYPGRLVKRIEPHITLVPPFDITDPTAYIRALQEPLRSRIPFSLQLGQPDSFGSRVLFLSVQDTTGMLHSLHSALYERALEHVHSQGTRQDKEERPYHPHLTLAMTSFGTSQNDMLHIREDALVDVASYSSIQVSSVRVYKKEKECWSPYVDLSLG